MTKVACCFKDGAPWFDSKQILITSYQLTSIKKVLKKMYYPSRCADRDPAVSLASKFDKTDLNEKITTLIFLNINQSGLAWSQSG